MRKSKRKCFETFCLLTAVTYTRLPSHYLHALKRLHVHSCLHSNAFELDCQYWCGVRVLLVRWGDVCSQSESAETYKGDSRRTLQAHTRAKVAFARQES